jgi:D-alanine-D-alanine ligase
VKPLHEDGSLGISKESVVYEEPALRKRVEYIVRTYHQPALVEEFIDGRELNVSLFERNGEVEILPISEIDYSEFPIDVPRICGYEAKWVPESLEYQKSKPLCPAPLDPSLRRAVEEIATRVYTLFGCRDYGRVDFRVSPENRLHVIDVNPNPDISPQSGMSRALKARGMTYTEFVEGLLEKALERRK